VKTEGDLPFAASELDAQLSARTVIDGSRSIVATVTGDGATIHVVVLGRVRDVALEGERGVDAARLVAFAIFDLAGTELDPPDAPHVTAPPPMRHVDAPLAHVATIVAAPVRDHTPRATLGVWGRGGSRTEGELELGVAVAGPIRALLAAGASTQTQLPVVAATALTTSAVFRTYPVRAGFAWRGPDLWLGQLEARATAILLVETASAQLARTDTIYGGGAAIAWAAPLFEGEPGGATLTIGAGLDGFATANEYRFGTMSIETTPRLAWWAGLGIAVELWQ
jgi:hypothetical protein